MNKSAGTIPVPKFFFEDYIGELSLMEMRVYLLLFMAKELSFKPSMTKIAERLKVSADEIFRAIKGLDDKGLVCFNEAAGVDGEIILLEDPVRKDKALNRDAALLDGAEQVKGSPLSASEVDLVFFLKEGLLFTDELILFLLDYCKKKDVFNREYIKKVAFSWRKNGINTVEKARVYNGGNKFNNFEQRQYDFKELERLLLDN